GNGNYRTFAPVKESIEGNGLVPFFHSQRYGQRNSKGSRKFSAGPVGRRTGIFPGRRPDKTHQQRKSVYRWGSGYFHREMRPVQPGVVQKTGGVGPLPCGRFLAGSFLAGSRRTPETAPAVQKEHRPAGGTGPAGWLEEGRPPAGSERGRHHRRRS